jgi:hypothetical protein
MEDDMKVRELRTRLEESFRELYKEMSDRNLALRNGMSEGLWSIRKELWEKEIRNTDIGALAYLAVLLGMAAKGFHWI